MLRRHLVFRVENYVPLIKQIAAKFLNRSSPQIRSWVELDDLVNDGIMHARTVVMKRFQPRMGNKFVTYLYVALTRYYIAYFRSLNCAQRKQTEEVEHEIQSLADDGVRQNMYVDGQDGMYSVRKIYDNASPDLRVYMEEWFGPDGPKRLSSSPKFRKTRREFLTLAHRFGVNRSVVADVMTARRMGLVAPLKG